MPTKGNTRTFLGSTSGADQCALVLATGKIECGTVHILQYRFGSVLKMMRSDWEKTKNCRSSSMLEVALSIGQVQPCM